MFFHPTFHFSGLAILFLIKIILRDKLHILAEIRKDPRGHISLAVTSALDSILISLALSLGPVAYVIAIRRVSLLFDIVLGHKLLNEGEFGRRLVGGIIVLTGVVMIAIAG
ncbi:MAG: hypothetical protein N2691_00665 [Patescibacteria group bacterium]|nr:hypothetical protein [Patescibacteria group bacterium]